MGHRVDVVALGALPKALGDGPARLEEDAVVVSKVDVAGAGVAPTTTHDVSLGARVGEGAVTKVDELVDDRNVIDEPVALQTIAQVSDPPASGGLRFRLGLGVRLGVCRIRSVSSVVNGRGSAEQLLGRGGGRLVCGFDRLSGLDGIGHRDVVPLVIGNGGRLGSGIGRFCLYIFVGRDHIVVWDHGVLVRVDNDIALIACGILCRGVHDDVGDGFYGLVGERGGCVHDEGKGEHED